MSEISNHYDLDGIITDGGELTHSYANEGDVKITKQEIILRAGSYGQKWWQSKLRDLIQEFGVKAIARSVLNVTYFPYASLRFGHSGLNVPTARYNFYLVREAIARQAVIVRMRTSKKLWQLWIKAVPELAAYPSVIRVRKPSSGYFESN